MSAYLNQRKTLSLRRNFSWTFVGNVVYAASQWGMLVIIARLGTPAMVGEFALGLALTAPIVLFSNLQLRGIQANDARRRFAFNDYLTLRLITTALALCVLGGLVATGNFTGPGLLILLIALTKSLESVSDVYYGLLQQHERLDVVAQSLMLRGVLSLAALAAGLYLTTSLLWGVVAMALCWAAVLVLFDIPRGARVLGSGSPNSKTWPSPERLGELARLALPLGFTMLLVSLNTNVPRYFIEQYEDTYALGIFSALAYIMVAGRTVVAALGQAASPRLSSYYAAGNRRAFRALATRLLSVGVLLGAGGVAASLLAGGPLLNFVYGTDYGEHRELFVHLMVAAAFIYVGSFAGYVMTAAQRFGVQAPLAGVVVLVSCLACWLLVPRYGLTGAALATTAAAAVQFALSALICWRTVSSLAEPEAAA